MDDAVFFAAQLSLKMDDTKTSVSNSVKIIIVDESSDGQRIDNFLLKNLPGVPKSHVYRLLRTGQVRVNKGRIKPVFRLSINDQVRIPPVRYNLIKVMQVPDNAIKRVFENMIFEDNDIIVLNKPEGLSVHKGTGVLFGVIEAVRQKRQQQSIELVHRLDRGTSGCLLLAKSRKSLLKYQEMFKQNKVNKHYLLLTNGVWKKSAISVKKSLIKNSLQSGERMVRISGTGKPAISHFKLIKQFKSSALVQVHIETGRTHQIRVHADYLGHPIIGDKKYGDQKLNKRMRSMGLKRMYLHAYRLGLEGREEFQAEPGSRWDSDVKILAEDSGLVE